VSVVGVCEGSEVSGRLVISRIAALAVTFKNSLAKKARKEEEIVIKMIKKEKFYYSFHTTMPFLACTFPSTSKSSKKRKKNDIKFIFNIRSNFKRLIIFANFFPSILLSSPPNAMNKFFRIIFISFYHEKKKSELHR
jgi:hypothetical protein